MITFTDQEWILVFAVLVALIVFTTAVICILYALIRALRLEEAREEAHFVSMVQNTAPLEVFPPIPEPSTNLDEKPDKVVLEMEAESDKEQTAETQTQSSYTRVMTDAISPPTTKAMPSPSSEGSSTLDVEFDKEYQQVTDYERRLAETKCLMDKLRQQLADKPKMERKVWFDEEPDVITASPEATTPKSVSIHEPASSPIFAPQSFSEPSPLKSKSGRKSFGQLPPLKSFTPPRTLTPRFLAPAKPVLPPKCPESDQAPVVPQKTSVFANRRNLKRPYSSIYKPVVHPFTFE